MEKHGALVLRLALGTMFIAHAGLKYYVFTLPGTAQFFQSLGLPAGLAYLTFWAELVGGVLILAGVYARWVAAVALAFAGDGSFAVADWLGARKLRHAEVLA